MSDAVKKQQGSARKPGRPKGSTTKKNTGQLLQRGRAAHPEIKPAKNARPYEEEEDMGFMRAEVIIICSFAVAILFVFKAISAYAECLEMCCAACSWDFLA